MQRGCTDRWCCANKQTGASKESKLKPLYYSLVLWAQAVGCRQGVTTNTCKLLLLIKITSHLHSTGTCSADHSKAKLRILPHALIGNSEGRRGGMHHSCITVVCQEHFIVLG
jgi:hypothetical protein